MNGFVHINQLCEHRLSPQRVLELGNFDVAIIPNRTGPGKTHTRLDRLSSNQFRVLHGKYRQLKQTEPCLP